MLLDDVQRGGPDLAVGVDQEALEVFAGIAPVPEAGLRRGRGTGRAAADAGESSARAASSSADVFWPDQSDRVGADAPERPLAHLRRGVGHAAAEQLHDLLAWFGRRRRAPDAPAPPRSPRAGRRGRGCGQARVAIAITSSSRIAGHRSSGQQARRGILALHQASDRIRSARADRRAGDCGRSPGGSPRDPAALPRRIEAIVSSRFGSFSAPARSSSRPTTRRAADRTPSSGSPRRLEQRLLDGGDCGSRPACGRSWRAGWPGAASSAGRSAVRSGTNAASSSSTLGFERKPNSRSLPTSIMPSGCRA